MCARDSSESINQWQPTQMSDSPGCVCGTVGLLANMKLINNIRLIICKLAYETGYCNIRALEVAIVWRRRHCVLWTKPLARGNLVHKLVFSGHRRLPVQILLSLSGRRRLPVQILLSLSGRRRLPIQILLSLSGRRRLPVQILLSLSGRRGLSLTQPHAC